MAVLFPRFRLTASVAALGVAMISVPAAAQTAPAADESDGETITVYAPIRDAQALAVEEQRNADNLVAIVAADSIGRFPDQNSAAALARLPAVAVQRDQGQERYIQVRGAPNRWTSVSFDGVPVIGVDEGGATRAFRFDAVPSVILSSIAVNKSLTPDIPAEAIVAQIDMRTFSAFDAKGFALSGDLGYGWMELGGGEQRQGSLRASWSNDTWGVMLAGSHYRRDQITDNREFAYDANDVVSTMDFRNYLLTRENNGASAGVEFRPADGQTLFLKGVWSEFRDHELRNQYVFNLAGAQAGGVRGNDAGDLVAVPVRGSLSDGRYYNSNLILTGGGGHELPDDWKLDWRANYTRILNTTDLPLILQNQQFNRTFRPSLTYTRDDVDLPIVQLFTTVPGATAGTYARGSGTRALNQGAFDLNVALPLESRIEADSWTAKADLDGRFGDMPVRFGLQYDKRDISGNVLATSTQVVVPGLPAASYVTTRPWRTNFPSGMQFFYVDNARLRGDLESALAQLEAAGRYNPDNNIRPIDRYEIDEKLFAAYARATWELASGQIVFGARLENFRQTSSGVVQVGAVYEPLDVSSDRWDLFPSVNAKFDLSDDIVARASVQRGVARPSFGQIRVGAAISDTSIPGTVTGGNPYLKPEYTWGADASLEYYLPGDGLVSVSGFYRRVENVLYDSRVKVGDDRYDIDGIDRSGYDFISTLNGDKGKLYGVELAYLQQWTFLPGPLDGFGFQGNIAFIGGSFDTPDRQGAAFPGTSDTVVNASLFYEKFGVSTRLSYQWRSDWVDTLGGLGVGSAGDEKRAGYGNLDLAVRVQVSENIGLFFDANNLTDEIYVAYQGERVRPTEVEQIGRRFMGGVRFNF
ncbi:TonB-dependent receptor [Sandaracinobacter sp.]|uniref:TonB-dependent receptor n=1 Tax=Sandaracinobacter sp. TaxID=2487581 RepID=UPI0035B0DEEB